MFLTTGNVLSLLRPTSRSVDDKLAMFRQIPFSARPSARRLSKLRQFRSPASSVPWRNCKYQENIGTARDNVIGAIPLPRLHDPLVPLSVPKGCHP